MLEAFVVALPSSRSLLSWIFSWPPLTMQAGLSSMSPPQSFLRTHLPAFVHCPYTVFRGLFSVIPPGSVSSRRGGTLPTAVSPEDGAVPGLWQGLGTCLQIEGGNLGCSLQNEGHVTPQAPFAKRKYILLSFSPKSPFCCLL